jgi:O-antigen/teichoic acid export membrane protein
MATTSPSEHPEPVSIRRSFLFSVTERYLATAIQFAASVIIARLLSPAEVGVYAVGTSILAIIQNVRELGMTQYIIQETELTEKRYGTAIAATLLISVAFSVVLWLASGWISAFYREPGLVPVLHLLAISLLVAPFSSPTSAKLQRQMEFAVLLKIGTITAIVAAVVSVALAALGASFMSLAWGSLCGSVVSLLLLMRSRWTDVLTRPRFGEWRRVLSFGLQSTTVSLLSEFGVQAAYLIVPRYLGFAAVGLYGRAQSMVALFSRDIATTVYRVLLPGFALSHRTGRDIKGPYLKSVAYMTAVAWPFYGVLAITAHPLILLTFGPAWIEAAPVARVLCLAGAVYATWSTSTQVIMGLGHMNKMVSGELIQQPMRIMFVLVATQWGLMAVAGAQVATMILGGVVYLKRLFPLIGISFLDIMHATIRSAAVTVCTLVPAAAVLYLATGHVGSFLQLVLVGLTSIIAWLAAIIVAGHPLKRELRTSLHWARVAQSSLSRWVTQR